MTGQCKTSSAARWVIAHIYFILDRMCLGVFWQRPSTHFLHKVYKGSCSDAARIALCDDYCGAVNVHHWELGWFLQAFFLLVKFHAVVRAAPEHATLRLYYWRTDSVRSIPLSLGAHLDFLRKCEPSRRHKLCNLEQILLRTVKLKLQSKKRLDESSFKWTEMEEIISLSHF